VTAEVRGQAKETTEFGVRLGLRHVYESCYSAGVNLDTHAAHDLP
jgi:hypothetical protein